MDEKKRRSASTWLICLTKCYPFTFSSSSSPEKSADEKNDLVRIRKKPGGWKSMSYILGNETFERLATIGLVANLMVYLRTQLHMSLVSATNLLNIWSGVTNFAPLFGAFISDAYVGRFRTIAVASFASFLGMVTLTLTAWMPGLHPPPCSPHQLQLHQCLGPTKSQLGIFLMGLGFLTIGTGGIRPCSIPFGVDQFDPTTEEGRKGINSFFNWYYTTFTIVLMIALTLVVYIQDSVSWALGFGIPTVLMVGSITLFFFGTRVYVYVAPEGSVFSDIARVIVVAYRKRQLKLLDGETDVREGVYYDPPLKVDTVVSKLPLTKQFRFLNKAAKIVDGEVKADGTPMNKWRLCSIQQIEEVKCLVWVSPIWASGIICFTSMAQQGTFTVSQALKMDRHLGPNFQVPAGSLSVISMLTLGLWVPFYDRILIPALRKITKHENGITLLQRMGIGMVFSVLSMVVAGLVEKERRSSAIQNPNPSGVAPMSAMWLAPQLILMGFAEAFIIIGQIEFFNKEFPEHMRSIANSLFFVTMAGANYLSSVVVSVVHGTTKKHGGIDWLANDINAGRVDYFYYLIAGLGVFNLVYYLVCANQYRYKMGRLIEVDHDEDEKEVKHFDVEMNPIKG